MTDPGYTKKTYLASKITDWYLTHKRDLPWRNVNDPYLIWVSEVILQQTRVAQGLPYYHKFIENFPTIVHLARASEQEILLLWQGLGYYSRARNMHAAAKYVAEHLQGVMPQSFSELLKLKGIGHYTAAAIASLAYGENVAVVDGNVFRVLARVFGITTDIISNAAKKEFTTLANEILPLNQSHIHNQAMMEFGALHCTPVAPKCFNCPISSICIAFEKNLQNYLPVKSKKKKSRVRYFNYTVYKVSDAYMMKAREHGDIWTGLYEFMVDEGEDLWDAGDIPPHYPEDSIIEKTSGIYKHVLTHQNIYAQFRIVMVDALSAKTLEKNQGLQLYDKDQINDLPKPVLITKFLNEYIF